MNKKLVSVLIFYLFVSFFFAEKISITKFTADNGSDFFWDPFTASGCIQKNGHTVVFRADDPIVTIDYSQLALVNPPEEKDGTIYIDASFTDLVKPVFENPVENNYTGLFKIGAILIDEGHGGKDPGAMETYTFSGKKTVVREKDITLSAAKKLYKLLKNNYPDKKILLTRDDDTFLSLAERVEKANSVQLKDNEAVVYVSIHVNAAFDKKAGGFEAWYLSPGYRRNVIDTSASSDKELLPILNSMMEEEYTTESILIAKYIIDGLTAQAEGKIASRGIKQEEWFVVRNAKMPSVLVELGFLTNPTEAALLINDDYLQKLTLGIYNGISSFITHFERSRGFTGL